MAEMLPDPIACPLCDRPNARRGHARDYDDSYVVGCEACRRFRIAGAIALDLVPGGPFHASRHILSGLSRQANEARQPPFEILSEADIRRAIAEAPSPRSPLDVIDRVLLDLIESLPSFDAVAQPFQSDYTRYFLRSPQEYQAVLRLLEVEGLIEMYVLQAHFQVKPKRMGWIRARELRERSRKSDQAFVAMRFHTMLAPAYDEGIKPALRRAGYYPLRIDRVHHNGTIDDRIIAEIRRSAFVVADLTENANGVYFEAGFSLGHSIDVIWSCREDHLERAHFDVRQYSMLVWTTPDELREKLYQRVRATMPVRDPISEADQ